MGNRLSIFGIFILVASSTVVVWSAPPKPPAETPESAATKAAAEASKTAYYTTRLKQIQDQLHSKDTGENQQGVAGLKDWIATDQKTGAKALLAAQNFMLWDSRYSGSLPELLDSVQSAQKDPPFLARVAIYKGYALVQAGKKDEGEASVNKAFAEYPGEACNVVGTDIINGLKTQKRNTELMDLSQRCMRIRPDNADMVDRLIKMRVGILNSANKEQEALGELKRLFNACPMDKTADALTAIDHQLQLISVGGDASLALRFQTEQVEGAKVGVATTNPITTVAATVMAGIKVNMDGYDAALNAIDGDTFQCMQQRCVLALLADKPDDALKWAKRAFGEANNPQQVKTATDLIARALKSQDGNVGRANAWINSNTSKKPEKP